VTFHDVAAAWFAITDSRLRDDQRAAFAQIFPQLREAFATPRGGIVTAVFCRRIRVAAALTSSDRAAENPEGVIDANRRRVAELPDDTVDDDEGRLHHAARVVFSSRLIDTQSAGGSAIHVETSLGDPADLKAKAILFTCLDLHNRAVEFLPSKPRKVSMRMIFGVVTALLGMLDARKDGELKPDEVGCLQNELDRAERYIATSMQRRAQLHYFVGMVWSWVALLLVFAAVAGVAALARDLPLIKELIVLTPLAGGLGAVVSVLQRMTSGRIRLVAEDGRRTIRILGAIRPVLGAILGLVLFVFLTGRLIPFDGKNLSAVAAPYYVLGLAFIAGFSERFAQDMLSGAAGGGSAKA
jgi:hypothetical protein